MTVLSKHSDIKRLVLPGVLWSGILTIIFLTFNWESTSGFDLLTSTPYFIVLYFLLFSVGRVDVARRFRNILKGEINKAVVFPAVLVLLCFSYIILNGQNPFQGTTFLFPYLIFFPVLMFATGRWNDQPLNWLDFATFFIFLLPTTLVKFELGTDLPFNGGGFDSVYRIVMMATAVYAFVVLRGLKDVGFFPVFSWKKLWIILWVWFVFYLFVFCLGYLTNFIQIKGHDTIDFELIEQIVRRILSIFLHTALFEELFFRGLLQNLLSKRISQTRTWKLFWIWGFAVLLVFSLITGYLMKGAMPWFPGLITILLFLGAFLLERYKANHLGAYTALAMTSVFFGLVHFHSGSIIFVGLASIGGWAYGYAYLKTKNVFYAALLHALVNSSALIFGLELMK